MGPMPGITTAMAASTSPPSSPRRAAGRESSMSAPGVASICSASAPSSSWLGTPPRFDRVRYRARGARGAAAGCAGLRTRPGPGDEPLAVCYFVHMSGLSLRSSAAGPRVRGPRSSSRARAARVAIVDGSHPREKPCGGGLSARALEVLRPFGLRVPSPEVRNRGQQFIAGRKNGVDLYRLAGGRRRRSS